jgi:hypothetical protein
MKDYYWTDQQIDLLTKYYGKIDTGLLADMIGRSKISIRGKADRLNITCGRPFVAEKSAENVALKVPLVKEKIAEKVALNRLTKLEVEVEINICLNALFELCAPGNDIRTWTDALRRFNALCIIAERMSFE